MKYIKKTQLVAAITGLGCALLTPLALSETSKLGNTVAIKVNCERSPSALKEALQCKPRKALNLILSGQCEGPLEINRTQKTVLLSAEGEKAIISIPDRQDIVSAVKVTSSNVTFKNLHFDLPADKKMLSVEHNAVVNIEGLSSNYHYGETQEKPHIYVLGNSSLISTNQRAVDLRVSGSSYAQFNKGNQEVSLIISDTSAVLAKDGSEFEKIDLWGNAHLEGNTGMSVNSLSLFGQSSAEVLSSQVAALTLGGRTMFAAYEYSTVTGPYTFYTNNYIFEAMDSSVNNWQQQDHPNALTIGFNAVVNGHTYLGWSWVGEDGITKAE